MTPEKYDRWLLDDLSKHVTNIRAGYLELVHETSRRWHALNFHGEPIYDPLEGMRQLRRCRAWVAACDRWMSQNTTV